MKVRPFRFRKLSGILFPVPVWEISQDEKKWFSHTGGQGWSDVRKDLEKDPDSEGQLHSWYIYKQLIGILGAQDRT